MFWPCSGHQRCPEHGQNMEIVRNMASFSWPCSGHQRVLSGIGPGKPGPVPDINVRCPEHGLEKLALFRTSLSFSGHVPDITGPIPDITGPIPDITGPIPDIAGHIPDINPYLLVVSQTWMCDVRNKARISWPCSGHQSSMSGIWPVSTVHVPDITH